jgi:CRISPR/Cas system-associated endoribonuclease Cas2
VTSHDLRNDEIARNRHRKKMSKARLSSVFEAEMRRKQTAENHRKGSKREENNKDSVFLYF